jgi:hypothetical protein
LLKELKKRDLEKQRRTLRKLSKTPKRLRLLLQERKSKPRAKKRLKQRKQKLMPFVPKSQLRKLRSKN